jgi:SAM-dependent methyltransferase
MISPGLYRGRAKMRAKLRHLVAQDPSPEGPDEGMVSGARRVAKLLRSGRRPPDRAFDCYLPDGLRAVSNQHWTPLAVAARAAEWFDELGIRTVVDIGSGAGKFCVIAALAGRCQLTGLEQRARLVAAARELARRFEVDDRVSFVHGTFGEAALPVADAYYFYNPFGENLFGRGDHLDEDVELSPQRHKRDTASTAALLQRAEVGTYLVTYNGFGGRVPASYQEVYVDFEELSVLRISRKVHSAPPPGMTP